jgi:NAD(P)-dependent dehydrogenase (short-subunit alcohol dehydrogenase family)
MKNILLFGSCGSIGKHIFTSFQRDGYIVFGTSTHKENIKDNIFYVTNEDMTSLVSIPCIDIVVWAQGHNYNDNITTFNVTNFTKMIDGNVTFILNTLNYLLKNNKIVDNSKMVIISSIWELYSRDNKLSYCISKSALSGLLKSLSYDLSKKNILINNVLPGVIDNEMTRKTLHKDQLEYITNYMHFKRLINVDDIYRTVKFLSIENTGITGQSICVDLGFTSIRKYS